jgi:hypothetical protein
MRELAKEGKSIRKIMDENFPELSYWDVYFEVRGDGGRGAIGIKRMITNRINALAESKILAERAEIAEELKELVWQLYQNHKTNYEKLRQIREAIDA